jgi:hypothetical protein
MARCRAWRSRLRDAPQALLGPDIPPDSPLGRAVLAEAGRMAETLEGSAAP